MQDQERRRHDAEQDDAADDQFVAPGSVPAADRKPEPEPDEPDRRDEPELVTLPSSVAHQPISGLVAAVVAGVLMLALGIYAATRTPTLAEMPFRQVTDLLFWIVAIAAILVAAVGTQFAELSARAGAVRLGQSLAGHGAPLAWALPTSAAVASVLLIATWHNVVVAVVGALVTLASVLVALLVRDLFDDLTDSAVRVAALVHGVMIHLVAFIGLAMLSYNKLPDWVAAPLVGLFAGLLILEALGRAPLPDHSRIGMAALGALVLAQAAIAIDRWPTWGWTGGIALLVTFFIANGLLVTWALTRTVARRDVGYYAGLGGVGLALIVLFGL